MKTRWLLTIGFAVTLFGSHFANATLVRVSDGSIVTNIASETTTVWNVGEGLLDGQLLGAFNINVDGALWDVVFKRGSFADVFGDASGLDATNSGAARRFAEALLTSVFLNLYDDDPALTFGCSDDELCNSSTPYDTDDVSFAVSIDALNYRSIGRFDDETSFNFNRFSNGLHDSDNFVWADWARSSVRTIPEPSVPLLILLGVAGLVMKRRKTLR